MPDEMVVQYCAPVLTGLKTANLFSFPFSDSAGMISDLRQLNQELNHSVRVCPLGKKKDRTLIYMYRPADLREDLSRKEAREILEPLGYDPEQMEQCLIHLQERLSDQKEFPHEIGLFLGYPPEDVRGFIEHRACMYCGVWQVYSNVDEAIACFEAYRRCTHACILQLERGVSLCQLAAGKTRKGDHL